MAWGGGNSNATPLEAVLFNINPPKIPLNIPLEENSTHTYGQSRSKSAILCHNSRKTEEVIDLNGGQINDYWGGH